MTLQTLHPKHFDHGLIVDQTPSPGLPIPDLDAATPHSLLTFVGPLGADILCHSISTGSFVDPQSYSQQSSAAITNATPSRHAPKITPEDRHIDWATWTASDILVRDRVLGRLWDEVTVRNLGLDPATSGTSTKRATFGQWRDLSQRLDPDLPVSASIGHPRTMKVDGEHHLCFHTCDGGLVSPAEVTIEGRPKGKGTDALFANAVSTMNELEVDKK